MQLPRLAENTINEKQSMKLNSVSPIRMFPDRAEFEKINSALGDKIFGEMTDVTRKEEALKDKASEERLGQLEEYQEDRKAARNKNLKENKNKTDLKSF